MCDNGEPEGGFVNGTPHPHHQQADDHRDVAHGVREEAPSLADHGHEDSGDRGPDDSRSVEHGGVQGDRVHQVFPADHVDEECLSGGDVERVRHAQQRRQHQDVPHLHAPRERQRGQEKRQHHGCRLGPDHDPLPVVRSAIVPPSGATSRIGIWLANPTVPRSSVEPVSR